MGRQPRDGDGNHVSAHYSEYFDTRRLTKLYRYSIDDPPGMWQRSAGRRTRPNGEQVQHVSGGTGVLQVHSRYIAFGVLLGRRSSGAEAA